MVISNELILFIFSPFGWVELGILDIRMLYILSFTLTEIVCAAGQASQFYAPGWLFGIGRWEWKSEAWGWHACTFCIRHRYLPLTSRGFLGLLQILDYWKGAYFLFFLILKTSGSILVENCGSRSFCYFWKLLLNIIGSDQI